MTLDCTKLEGSKNWLKNGSTGEQVRELQILLQKHGFYIGYKIDGKFQSKTDQAVREFQTKTGNTRDGQVGPKTCKSLNNIEETTKVAGFDCPHTDLKENQPNDASLVKKLQQGLQQIGYYKGYKVDGNYGPYTSQAVAAFQRNNELSPDGWFGPKSCVVFNKLLGWGDGATTTETKTTVTVKKKAEEIVIDAEAANFLSSKQANLTIEGVYFISTKVEDTRSVENADWQMIEMMGDKTYTYMGHTQPREYEITVPIRKDDWFKARKALIQMTKKVCQVSGFGITAGKYVLTWTFSVTHPNWYQLVFHLIQYRG